MPCFKSFKVKTARYPKHRGPRLRPNTIADFQVVSYCHIPEAGRCHHRAWLEIHCQFASYCFGSPKPGQFGRTSISTNSLAPLFSLIANVGIFIVAFLRGTPSVRHIYHRVPMWHAVCLAYLPPRSDVACRLFDIFIAMVRRGTPPVRHIYRHVPTRHDASPAYLWPRSDVARRSSSIFTVAFRRDTPFVVAFRRGMSRPAYSSLRYEAAWHITAYSSLRSDVA